MGSTGSARASALLASSLTAALLSLTSIVQAQVPGRGEAPPASIAVFPRSSINTFTIEVLKDFDSWDIDHDGVLSDKEIDARVRDPNTTGPAAAAIGAIKMAMRSGKFILPPLTRDYFQGYAADAQKRRWPRKSAEGEAIALANPETALLPTDPAKTNGLTPAPPSTDYPVYQAAFASALRRIRSTPKAVFATEQPLTLDAIHQGGIGDCYLLSVLGAMIHRDPAGVNHLVKVGDDGACDVTLPTGMTTHIAPITDAEVAVSSGAAGTGRWLPLLEEAYGRFHLRMKTGATTDVADALGTDDATKGGSVYLAIHNLTGHPVSTINFLHRGQAHQVASAEQFAPRMPEVRKAVSDALRENRLVAAGTGTGMVLPPAISTGHAYAIIGFDAATDTVTIWNPHNNNFTPKGDSSLKDGYQTKGGVFSMPLLEFGQVFPSINIEMPAEVQAGVR